ncbi:Cache domain-containing protein [Acidithiobacillus caldus]|uniref:N-linked glycosylation glycosyltransferase PglG n=1 Tax=Acidithiobacillus caldus (strain SM-1) TaxID=990288 RepID=F9ZPS8_ACICS|nr:PDC sensor domain-containing protein [Acidithiobacillus caldus]AEK58517.1 N-linked glycosylation glycosyltransferase PglG [Acidithiobacillus caldus SM-1]AUW33099.1 Cache domain-containing protein [Acidithiobacillus caldus]MBU2801120.1 Cache domain-containing protein [Acidithiobacillus caldus]QER43164.1 hypothetical protein F0726_00072 [Acidithiobacillus caldus]
MNRFEHFRELRSDILRLIAGPLESIAQPTLFSCDAETQRSILRPLLDRHPFIELVYLLDPEGRQIGDNLASYRRRGTQGGAGADRSHRPYYRLAMAADDAVLTDPYLSSANNRICVTVAIAVRNAQGAVLGIVVADSELDRALALLEEDDTRRLAEPYFKMVYAIFSLGLLIVSLSLGLHAGLSLERIWSLHAQLPHFSAPFQATILFTLALAVFDLAKTIFEEEVLLRKDIRRHSSTRRTLTRFIAAILIAVSIEGLMLVFKFALDDPPDLWLAVALLAAAALLLLSLGGYVYLGARAETLLLAQRARTQRS